MTTRMKMTTYTTKWTTVCTVAFTVPVSRDQNKAAHGGACHCQIRRGPDGDLQARKVLRNGRAEEIGEVFTPDPDQVAHWEQLGRDAR